VYQSYTAFPVCWLVIAPAVLVWSKAPQWGISCHPPLISDITKTHTHETLSLTVLTTLFLPSRQTPTTDPGLPRGLNSTTFYTSYFRRLAVVSSQHGSFGQPPHKLCWLLASTPTQLDPALDFLTSKSESKPISCYDVDPIYTYPTNLRTKTNSLYCTAPSHLYSRSIDQRLQVTFKMRYLNCTYCAGMLVRDVSVRGFVILSLWNLPSWKCEMTWYLWC